MWRVIFRPESVSIMPLLRNSVVGHYLSSHQLLGFESHSAENQRQLMALAAQVARYGRRRFRFSLTQRPYIGALFGLSVPVARLVGTCGGPLIPKTENFYERVLKPARVAFSPWGATGSERQNSITIQLRVLFAMVCYKSGRNRRGGGGCVHKGMP